MKKLFFYLLLLIFFSITNSANPQTMNSSSLLARQIVSSDPETLKKLNSSSILVEIQAKPSVSLELKSELDDFKTLTEEKKPESYFRSSSPRSSNRTQFKIYFFK